MMVVSCLVLISSWIFLISNWIFNNSFLVSWLSPSPLLSWCCSVILLSQRIDELIGSSHWQFQENLREEKERPPISIHSLSTVLDFLTRPSQWLYTNEENDSTLKKKKIPLKIHWEREREDEHESRVEFLGYQCKLKQTKYIRTHFNGTTWFCILSSIWVFDTGNFF